jgi:DNA gyrase subunit A
MKLDEGDRLIAVRTCSEDDDVLLATLMGKCIRFRTTDVRVFTGRNSTGNRGIALAKGDEVISMSILDHVDIEGAERAAYVRMASALRRGAEAEEENGADADDEEDDGSVTLSSERFDELAAREQFILTIADSGLGKRSSAFEYRNTRRGGKGIELMKFGSRDARVAAAFPVLGEDQIMLVTNGGKLIRTPVGDIRIAGRSTRGVTLFRIGEDEHVVSVAHLGDVGEDDDDDDAATVDSGTSEGETDA